MTTHHSPFAGALLLSVIASATIVGCAETSSGHARPYTEGRAVEILDIQVQREETVIRLTNTSARAFGASTVWINASYALEIEGFGVGESLTLDLGSFVDEFGNRFRAGGFFATRRPYDLVLTEIEDASGDRYGLVTVRGEGL